LKKSSVVNPFPVLPNVERETGGSTNKKKQDTLTYLMIFMQKEKFLSKNP
jgi:hypothetical protein